MTDLKNISKNQYDVAIIGSELPGLLTAYILSKQYHLNVALLEPSEEIGGQDNILQTSKGRLEAFFQYVPATEENKHLLNWLGDLLNDTLVSETLELQTKTFENAKLTPFIGFGERKFFSANELSQQISNSYLKLALSPEEWTHRIKEYFIGDTFTLATPTNIEAENSSPNSHRITSMLINGAKPIRAKFFIYTLPPKILGQMHLEFIANKQRQKILKAKSWTQINLHFTHKQVESEDFSPHVLMGNKTDFEPCLGHFFPPQEGKQNSIWSSLTTNDLAEDHEYLGGVIRNMKKQIKRAYENAINDIENEKIVIKTEAQGYIDLAGKNFGQLDKVDNLYLCHPQLVDQSGPMAGLSASQQILAQISKEFEKNITAPSPQGEVMNTQETSLI